MGLVVRGVECSVAADVFSHLGELRATMGTQRMWQGGIKELLDKRVVSGELVMGDLVALRLEFVEREAVKSLDRRLWVAGLPVWKSTRHLVTFRGALRWHQLAKRTDVGELLHTSARGWRMMRGC